MKVDFHLVVDAVSRFLLTFAMFANPIDLKIPNRRHENKIVFLKGTIFNDILHDNLLKTCL